MTFEQLSKQTEDAMGAMRDKRAALDAAQQRQRAVIDEAQAATAAAQRDYEAAVGQAQELRKQINAALAEIPSATASGVVVN